VVPFNKFTKKGTGFGFDDYRQIFILVSKLIFILVSKMNKSLDTKMKICSNRYNAFSVQRSMLESFPCVTA